MAANPQLAEIMAMPLTELSAGEQIQTRKFFLRFMKNLEFLFLENKDRSAMPINMWRQGVDEPDNLQMWKESKQGFNNRFVEFVETELTGR